MQLVVIEGPDKGRTLDLIAGSPLIIGRGRDSNTQLLDPHTSRKHCRFELKNDTAVVTDLGSSAGTFVNGEPVTERPLESGDVIGLGETRIRFFPAGSTDAETVVVSKRFDNSATESLDALVGAKVSHFQIEKKLGNGQSGVVFLASDTDNDQKVALKILLPEISKDEDETKRFIRAMKTMMPIRHPNLVAIRGAGKTDSYCWIAMQYVEGESLTSVIERIGTVGMLDWTYGFRVALDIAQALETAHGRKIIHRNVKPSNILIRTSDKSALLGDTMLAKALEGTMVQQITKPGELIGDVHYMSPEHTSIVKEVDERADIYSLGATVYGILTGRPPFEGKSLPDVVHKIRNDEPASPKSWQLSIPDAFVGIVLRMLAKRPEDRFQSAGDLLADLRRVGKFQGMSV